MVGLQILGISGDGGGMLNWTFSLKGELPGDHTGWYCGFPFGGWHSVFLSYIV